MLHMDVKKTREYYEQLSQDDLCQCDYCQNYIQQIKSSYPLIADYLLNMGVDIGKPFETGPLEPDEDGYIEYIFAQYIVYGECDGFDKTALNGVNADVAELHPSTDIKEAHFVIEIYPVRLKWIM